MNLHPSDIPPAIRALHLAYETITGYAVTLNWPQTDAWRTFMAYRQPAFTAEDIGVVVRHVRKKYEPRFHAGMLRFSKLIQNPDWFEEYLSAAICEMRPRQPKIKTVREGGFNKIVDNPGTGDSTVPVSAVLPDLIAKLRQAAG